MDNDEHLGCKVFRTVKMLIMICWGVTKCSLVLRYRRFGGTCHLYIPLKWRQQVSPIHWYPPPRSHNVEKLEDNNTEKYYQYPLSTSSQLSLFNLILFVLSTVSTVV
jgi:hypothetical protein